MTAERFPPDDSLPPWARDIAPPSPHDVPSIDDLGKPPQDDPLAWNPRLREALDLIRATSSDTLREALVSMGFVNDEEILNALAVECKMERVDWNSVVVTPDLLAHISDETAWRLHVFPVRFDDTHLWVALSDPLDDRVVPELEKIARKKVVPMIAAHGEVMRMLGIHY